MRVVAVALALTVAACASGGTDAAARGSVAGRVVSAPSCPVQRAGVRCPPRPVTGASVEALRAGNQVASAETDAAGRFELSLAAGRYVIRATNAGGLATTAQRSVQVSAGATTHLRLVVDSGIR